MEHGRAPLRHALEDDAVSRQGGGPVAQAGEPFTASPTRTCPYLPLPPLSSPDVQVQMWKNSLAQQPLDKEHQDAVNEALRAVMGDEGMGEAGDGEEDPEAEALRLMAEQEAAERAAAAEKAAAEVTA